MGIMFTPRRLHLAAKKLFSRAPLVGCEMETGKKEKTPLTKTDPHDPAATDGRWIDGICDCCRDPGMCAIVYCCDPVSTGQLYERVVQKGLVERIPMLSCVSISAFLWVCYVWSSVLSGFGEFFGAVGIVLGTLSGVCLFLIVCTVRKAIRTRDGIEPGSCGDFEDCCCAFWCNSCTQCQLWRHERVNCAQYDLCNKTGSKLAAEEIHEIAKAV